MPSKITPVFETTIAGYPIHLYWIGADKYTVRYGLQLDTELRYEHAAAKLGQAIMHALTCEGKME